MRLEGGEMTDWFNIEVGLRQGCVLSPILFSIFIDGLAEKVKSAGGVKYGRSVADDIVLVAENPKMLQRMLDIVYAYSRKFRFRFNQEKSNVMFFGRRSKKWQFRMGEKELKLIAINI